MATAQTDSERKTSFTDKLRDNGLSLALIALFLLFWVGQALTGQHEYNEEQRQHGQPQLDLREYLKSSHFLEATAENWESEFLQMSAYVLFTCFLYQRGSAESKSPDEEEEVDRDPQLSQSKAKAPWPVRHGGWVLTLYSSSLSIAFVSLFFISFALHAIAGTAAYNETELTHGGQPISTWEYLQSAQFWFESLQNWQSEFLAIVSMVVLSIFLRQRGSPESKPVDAPHGQTGTA
jgi:hypothetical protein